MKIYYDHSEFKVEKPVLTIGVFDGVHKGHTKILNRLQSSASEIGGESVVLTFWPHPRLVLKLDTEIKLINTLKEKEDLLEQNGVQHLVVFPFTEEFSLMEHDEFVKNILVDGLRVKRLIIGFNHHFGKGRGGNFEYIQQAGRDFGFEVEKLDAQLVENEKVSSTLIRKALNNGDVLEAKKYLGYSYNLTGKVAEGKKIGRQIGFPTANLQIDDEHKIIPFIGVYAGNAKVNNIIYPCMINIGYKPTVSPINIVITIEAHLIGFSGDLYNQNLTLFFEKRLRDEMKFSGLEALTEQLKMDQMETVFFLNNLKY